MNGITYVKLESQYPEDYTKRAALTPLEIDNNFNTLEGRDVKSISVFDGKLTINLYNGDTLCATVGSSDQDKVADVVFDQPNGVLTLVFADGTTKSIEGFATKANTGVTVSVDNSLKGNGLPGNPIGVSPLAKTGWYRPVEEIIHICDKEKLPHGKNLPIGTRYLTVERVSDYGFLYNYDALRTIACDLRAANSPWRVPTKADWDDMLNAVEPCAEDRVHELASANRYLGRFAGKFLKSKDLWLNSKFSDCVENTGMDEDQEYIDYGCDCKDSKETFCKPPVCGEHGPHHPHPKPMPSGGIDKYGFRVTPAGYIDDGGNHLFFKERAQFWTATNLKMTTAYVKRFEFNHDNVHQDIVPTQMRLSIRLVKDYDGSNYNEREDILGHSCSTVLMPSMKDGSKIWTSANISLGDPKYHPMVPNDGHGLTFGKHFFINEWNGKEWIRQEMHDGESVIVKHAPDHSRNSEYRVIDGEIANVSLSIIKTVSHGMKHILDGLNHKIEHEIERSIKADKSHDESIKDIQERLSGVENRIPDIDNMQSAIEQIVEDVESNKRAIEELGEKFENETKRLDEAITEEKELREKADQEEADARIKADEEEKTAREEADSAINKEIEDIKIDVENLQKDVEDMSKDMDQLEEDLNKRIDDLDQKVSDEIDGLKKSDEDIIKKIEDVESKLLVQEGSEYNPNTGEVLLKSVGGENDITIKMSYDFGTF